jgi:hypothetical protein
VTIEEKLVGHCLLPSADQSDLEVVEGQYHLA